MWPIGLLLICSRKHATHAVSCQGFVRFRAFQRTNAQPSQFSLDYCRFLIGSIPSINMLYETGAKFPVSRRGGSARYLGDEELLLFIYVTSLTCMIAITKMFIYVALIVCISFTKLLFVIFKQFNMCNFCCKVMKELLVKLNNCYYVLLVFYTIQ